MKSSYALVFVLIVSAMRYSNAQDNLGTSYYTVNGTTLRQAFDDMPGEEAGSMHYYLSYDPYGTNTVSPCNVVKNADNTCTYSTTTTIDPTRKFKWKGGYWVFLPRWDRDQEAQVCVARQNAWNTSMDALAQHEQHHVDIFIKWFNGAAEGYAAQINAVVGTGSGATCSDATKAAQTSFRNQVTVIYNKAIAEIKKLEDDFDYQKDHGKTDTPPCTINLDTPCQ